MGESKLKARYLRLLTEPFSLDIPYANRQQVVIVADEQIETERRSRADGAAGNRRAVALTAAAEGGAVTGGVAQPMPEEPDLAALLSRNLRRSAHGAQDASMRMTRAVNDQAAKWAVRRQLAALMIRRSESAILHFDQGHPLNNLLYIGHPGKPDLYFPAAEFHRRVFEHKFVEAVRLLTALGARRITVHQEHGHIKGKERTSIASTAGFSFTRREGTLANATFEAELPGSSTPFIPDDLCWYPDERTWQMIADARIASGAQKTSLAVSYMTDYGIDMRVMKAAGRCGINIGGRFEEQHNTVWRLDAEFPGISDSLPGVQPD